ncbi:MAG: arsenate reductase (glutaredoxin) [Planctomycetes bacterium]|nr:arsenate reductase (glutaredoxin) [Planctomycetota bacterium]
MPDVTIYHNPRCSKSRQTLQILTDRGIEPKVVEYLKDPPDEKRIESLLKMLGMEPAQLLRRGEAEYKDLGLDKKLDDRKALIRAMAQHPVLIERPIVVKGNKARLGRPPEQVEEIL